MFSAEALIEFERYISGLIPLKDFVEQLKQALLDKAPPIFRKVTISYKGARESYYSYCDTHRLHHFGKQRQVSNCHQADLSDKLTFLISIRSYQ